MSYVIRDEHAGELGPVGGKAKSLAVLTRAGFPVPRWFVLTPDAFYHSLTSEQKMALNVAQSAGEIQGILQELVMAPAVQEALEEALILMCRDEGRVAVRSSAMDEDGRQFSFAGQLSSFLFVSAQEVQDKVLAVWRSAFTEQVLAYRRAHSMTTLPTAPAVLVQQMVDAQVSGVAFGVNPMTGDRETAVISAVYGLGTALVSGQSNADMFYVNADESITSRIIARKELAHRFNSQQAEGVAPVAVMVPDMERPCLDDRQVQIVARLVRHCGEVMGCPQDIEWALSGDRLYLLQSRPITTVAAGTSGEEGIHWDCTDAMESWPGVTTPLTFSFARHFYAGLYRQFAVLMQMPNTKLCLLEPEFDEMIGLIRGRIYFNITRVGALWTHIPGVDAGRAVARWLFAVGSSDFPLEREHIRFGEWRTGFKTFLALARHYAGLRKSQAQLAGQVEATLATPSEDIAGLRDEDWLACYHQVETVLRDSWGPPLLNNLAASFLYRLVGHWTALWCDDADGSLCRDLLSVSEEMAPLEALGALEEMARLAAMEPGMVDALNTLSLVELEALLDVNLYFKTRFQRYLMQYGERCQEDFRLESPNIAHNPLAILRTVGRFARHSKKPLPTADALSGNRLPPATVTRAAAEQVVELALAGKPFRQRLFQWAVTHARARIRDRENNRFLFSRLVGRLRTLFLAVGQRMHQRGLLIDPRDVFYLTVPVVLDYLNGTCGHRDFEALIEPEKTAVSEYLALPEPPLRLVTSGQGDPNDDVPMLHPQSVPEGDVMQGIGCSPGRVQGTVRMVTDVAVLQLGDGEILVSAHGDPGLVMLFPFAAGLLLERGSPLSHLAIVAREMGIPAVVAVPELTRWLKDGDIVILDGKTGLIRKLPLRNL